MEKTIQRLEMPVVASVDRNPCKADLPSPSDNSFRHPAFSLLLLMTAFPIAALLSGCTGFQHAWYMHSAVFQPSTAYSHATVPRGINARYVGIANRAGHHYNVSPALILAVCDEESGFNARAVSSTGAEGLMQLMPDTAAQMGVSRPFDARQAIWGGTRYLALLLRRYGDNVRLALAAYHSGAQTISDADSRVPPQSRSYVAGVLARYRYFLRFPTPSKSEPQPRQEGTSSGSPD